MSNSDSGDSRAHALGELRCAEMLGCARQWAEADACFVRAIEMDPTPMSRLAFGASLAEREQYHDAICQLTAGLELASAQGDRQALATVFHNLASIYRELGDFELARRFQSRAILQMDECGPEELLGLANDAWTSRHADIACCLAESSVDLEEDNDVALEAQATTAAFVGICEDPRPAIKTLIHVYRQHRSAGSLRLMGIDLLNLSALFAETGWHRTEMNLVRQAIQHFEAAPAPVSATKARRVLDMLERMQSLREFDPSAN